MGILHIRREDVVGRMVERIRTVDSVGRMGKAAVVDMPRIQAFHRVEHSILLAVGACMDFVEGMVHWRMDSGEELGVGLDQLVVDQVEVQG